MEIQEDVVIVGAGIAGVATALALKRVGVRSLVLERSDELRTTGAALALAPNAWIALHALGVAHKLTSIYTPFKRGKMINVANGTSQDISLGTEEKEFGARSVHRRNLLDALAEELPTDTIRFSSKLISIETGKHEGSSITILHMDDGTIIKAKVLIGCDGVHSVVARWLGLSDPVDSGRAAVRGLAKFPQGHGFNHEVQMFINQGLRAGISPLNDKEIYWFITCKSGAKIAEEMALGDLEAIHKNVIENLAKDFPPTFLEVVRHADLPTLSWAPLMLRYPWNLILGNVCKGNVTIAGDAMHPMTPDLGQGGCAALEDAVVLGRHIGNSFLRNGGIVSREVEGAIKMYVKERRWRAATLITASFISGLVQQGESGWLMKFIRDTFFFRYLFSRLFASVQYDCGKLPSASSAIDSENHNKSD